MKSSLLMPLALLIAIWMVGCGGSPAGASSSSSTSSNSSGSLGSSTSSSSSTSASSSSSSTSSSSSSSSSGDITFQQAELDPDVWYSIINSESGLAFDILEFSEETGAPLLQWEASASTNQQFRFIESGNNYHRIMVRHSGLVLDIYELNENDGADIVQWEDSNGENQRFQVQLLDNGNHRLVSRLSGKALVPENESQEPLARITLATPGSNPSQQWLLTEVDTVTGPAPNPDGEVVNPSTWNLNGNLGTHDPAIIEENGIWWQFQTGVGIYGKRSSDGLNWEPLPSVFPQSLSWWKNHVPDHVNNDVWAPDIYAFNGRVWMYYSISTFGSRVSAIGLASATSIAAGNWRDDGLVIATNDSHNYNAIDPDLITTPAGDPWMVFGSWNNGIMLTAIDSGTMKPTGQLYNVASRSGGIEGPTLIYRNGYYYLFVSVGRCCAGTDSTYQILAGRSATITGPYLDRNGTSMRDGGGTVIKRSADNWIGPGGQDIHNGVIAYHAYDANRDGDAFLRMETLGWDSDGWPYLP